jgi:hypothetical protein
MVPPSWREDFLNPVVRLNLAIYGHPESEMIWNLFLDKVLMGRDGAALAHMQEATFAVQAPAAGFNPRRVPSW